MVVDYRSQRSVPTRGSTRSRGPPDRDRNRGRVEMGGMIDAE